jgi:hypothetical protein
VRLQYTGQVAVTYMDYLDLDTGKSLTVAPGGVYNVTLASGRLGDSESVPQGFIKVPVKKPDDLRRGVAKPDASTPEIKEN